jgi:hypothetical protein
MHQLLPRLALTDNDTFEVASEPIVLDRARLHEALHQLAALSTMVALRQAIDGLYTQIADIHSPLHAPDGIRFAPDYLRAELAQIRAAYTIERAHYYVARLIKGMTEVRTGAVNDINLNRWKEYEDIYTDSLWRLSRRDGSGAHTAGYWGNFIPQIPHQMMRRYTRAGDWVLDPFAGSGTTLIEARRLGRNCLGIELQADIAAQARTLIASEPDRHGVASSIVTGDCLSVDYPALLAAHGCQSVQLAILHPPYYDIIKFSDDPRDLSNASSLDAFLSMIGTLAQRVSDVLDSGRYMVLVIGDKYAKCEWIPLGFYAMNAVLEQDFTLKSIVVKNFEQTAGKRSQEELWRYRALVGGFYVFKHEYIFIFRKR